LQVFICSFILPASYAYDAVGFYFNYGAGSVIYYIMHCKKNEIIGRFL